MRRALIHFIIVLLLMVSWFLLQEWYRYWNSWVGWLFGGSFPVALLLMTGKRFLSSLREVGRHRAFIVIVFLFLCLPWGEWLRLALPEAREDWTRQLFLQICFLYVLSLIFAMFPAVLRKVSDAVQNTLRALAGRNFVLWLPSLLFFLFSSFIAVFVVGQIPGTEDAAAHLFQGKIFSKFQLFAPAPPAPDFFDFQGDNLVIHEGKWFSMYFPGFALLLAPAILMRAEWFVSPLLGALTLAIWIRYIRRWHSKELAIFFAVLFLFSPFLLLMSSAMMIHTPELLIASLIFYLTRSIVEKRSAANLLGLFLAVLGAMMIRPFSILIFVSPALLYLLYVAWKQRVPGLMIAPIAGCIAGAVLIAFYQWMTTGSPWLPAYVLEIPNYSYGFGQTLYDQVHTPARGLENISNLILGLNSWLTRWDSGVIFFLVLFILQGKRTDAWDKIFLSSAFCLGIFQFFFVGQDLAYGPRFFYLLAPVFLFYVTRTSVADGEEVPGSRFATAAILISVVIASAIHSPVLIRQHRTSNQLRELARSPEKMIFLAEESLRPLVSHNDPFLRNKVLYCLDLRSRNLELADAFPGYRRVFFKRLMGLEGTEVTGDYEFSEVPDEGRSGVVNLFQLASMLDSEHVDRDWFDLAYRGLISSERATLNLQYLESLVAVPTGDSDYRTHFRAGLISAGLLLARPASAYAEMGKNWRSALDEEDFRTRFLNAESQFEKSGAIGRRIRSQLRKISRRIDRNDNGEMSDHEILNFLSYKIRLLEKY